MLTIPSLYRGLSIGMMLVAPVFVACEGTLGNGPDDGGDGGDGDAPGSGQAGNGGFRPGGVTGAGGSAGTPAGGSGAGSGSGDASSSSSSSGAVSGSGSTTASASSTSSSGGGPGEIQDLCVATINAYRATLGLPPYARWAEAEVCSDGAAESDGSSGTAHGAFGTCDERAQNECPGWDGPPEQMIGDCLQAMWNEGPGEPFSEHGHYVNMSSTSYTRVACGFHTFPDGSVWAVQNFQ
jgi:hypothetical protein